MAKRRKRAARPLPRVSGQGSYLTGLRRSSAAGPHDTRPRRRRDRGQDERASIREQDST